MHTDRVSEGARVVLVDALARDCELRARGSVSETRVRGLSRRSL